MLRCWRMLCLLVFLGQGCADEPLVPPKETKAPLQEPKFLPKADPSLPVLDERQRGQLREWYEKAGGFREGEYFGKLLDRVARVQMGKPYIDHPQKNIPETLSVRLDDFQCVSFVEGSLALARCIWKKTPDEDCYLKELRASRYRDGVIAGYPSRLHYFTDWLDDNSKRNRLKAVGGELGAKTWQLSYSFMSDNPRRYPALVEPENLRYLKQVEERLSAMQTHVLERDQLKKAQKKFRVGDLVSLVGDKKGLLIVHAGFVSRGRDGIPRLLHASSYHKKVVLTGSVANYVLRKPNRRGIVLSRPLPP